MAMVFIKNNHNTYEERRPAQGRFWAKAPKVAQKLPKKIKCIQKSNKNNMFATFGQLLELLPKKALCGAPRFITNT